MKNILKAIAVTAAMIGLSGGVASAATTCNGTITNTGPNSTNTITCSTNNTTTVACVNNIIVDNSNGQAATSGQAFTTGNTTGGGASSGGASNTNSFEVTIGASCAPVTTTTTTPDTPATPQVLADETAQVAVVPVGGAGAGAGAGATTNNVAAAAGILGSAGLVALGFALRKRAFNA